MPTDPYTLTGDPLRQLITDLLDYARHAKGCSRVYGTKYRCRCGWADMCQEYGWVDIEADTADGDEDIPDA